MSDAAQWLLSLKKHKRVKIKQIASIAYVFQFVKFLIKIMFLKLFSNMSDSSVLYISSLNPVTGG